MVDECSKGESCKKWCMVRMGKKLQKVVQKLHKASCFEEMENALDKLDDLEYELEKAYEWLDDHKGDKRKSCSSRKKVCMLQKACERLRDAYEDEFEEESSDEDDDGWVCMESLVHQVGIPKMEEKETKKEAGQKSLEEPLDNLILPLECAHGVEEEYPLLKITPILSHERMEIGIWREDLKIQESQKGTPHNLIPTPTTIDAIDVSCLYEEDFSKEHAILFHKDHEMLIYPLISYGVLLEAILCDGMCISIHTMNYWKHDGACLPIHATTLYLNHARIMMSNFAQRLDGKIWFYLIDYHDGITQWFFLLLYLEGNCLWYFILKDSLKDDDGFLWMAQCIVKMDVFEACYVKANDFLEVEAYARHGDVCNMKLKIMEDVPTLKMVSTLCSWSSHMLISLWFHKFILYDLRWHITSRKDFFCSLDAAPAGKKVTCANNASYPIKGVGKILITISDGSDLCLPDVLYVPGIKKNLLSVSSLAKNGLRVIFEDDRCIVRDRENGYSLITTGTLENGLFVLDRYEKQIQACIAETKTQAMQDAELWHARFGHVGYGSLMTLQRHNMVHDLSLLEMPPRHVCEGCVLGKMHRFAFSQDGSVRATRKLQLVHSDVRGPMRTPSVGNSLYFVTFIDDFSRFCWVYPLKAKSDVFAIFQHYVSMVENETGCKVKTLRTDRGGEYMSGAFKDFLEKKGIKHQCTMPYTPQQNGVTERKNRSLMEMARCMLKAKSLPHKLWMEAVACAAHVLNRCPTRALKTITPYESWYGKKPSVSYLRVFGCLAYAHIPQRLRGKLDDKAVKCIFVGYSSGSKGYRLYNPATNKIFESRDVIFAETTAQPMVAFDVPHMQT
ncbi:hypothetical protein L7F22_016601 [Adiantum nelumboides]|nr:hypothetical protein [Adiantum nelumboides]